MKEHQSKIYSHNFSIFIIISLLIIIYTVTLIYAPTKKDNNLFNQKKNSSNLFSEPLNPANPLSPRYPFHPSNPLNPLFNP